MTSLERLIRGFIDEAINTGDLSAFDRFCSADYAWHGGADPAGLGEVHGIENFKAAVGGFFTGFPDVHADILDLLVEGDRAAV